MGYAVYEKQSNGTLKQLTIVGEHTGEGATRALQISKIGPPTPTAVPLPPVLSGSLTTRTSATLTWTAPQNTGRPPITEYRIFRSTDGGAATLAGTVGSTVLTFSESGLPTSTSPEKLFVYTVRAVNADGVGDPSNSKTLQWSSTPVQQPTAPTSLGRSGLLATQVTLTWVETADATVDKHAIYVGNTLTQDNLDPLATSYTWTGLTPNTTYSTVNVRRHNSAGWSPASNNVTFTTTTSVTNPVLFTAHQPGKVYLGFARLDGKPSHVDYLGNPPPTLNGWSEGQTLIGSPANTHMGVRRFYNYTNAAANEVYNTWNAMLWQSAKATDFGGAGTGPAYWGQIAAGSLDGGIRTYFQDLINIDRPVIFTFHHEPENDVSTSNPAPDVANWVAAWTKIMDVVDARWPGHKIVFTCNMQGFRWRTNTSSGINMNQWMQPQLLDRWKLVTFDMYHNNSNDPWFSNRAGEIMAYFEGNYVQPGATRASWLAPGNYTLGADLVLGVGEHAGRYAYYDQGTSNVTPTQWMREAHDFIAANQDIFAVVCAFNSIGVEDERLELPKFSVDTETTMAVWRERANSGLTCKITDLGL